jgi:hypothetical protein
MGIHDDLIAEKLEIARTIGFVTGYLVNSTGLARQQETRVQVWRSRSASDEAARQYLMRLLDGLLSDNEIVVTPPMLDWSAKDERVVGPIREPVSVAV